MMEKRDDNVVVLFAFFFCLGECQFFRYGIFGGISVGFDSSRVFSVKFSFSE